MCGRAWWAGGLQVVAAVSGEREGDENGRGYPLAMLDAVLLLYPTKLLDGAVCVRWD